MDFQKLLELGGAGRSDVKPAATENRAHVLAIIEIMVKVKVTVARPPSFASHVSSALLKNHSGLYIDFATFR